VEQGEVHGDEGGQMMMIKAPTWKRRKRKTKTYEYQGKGINRILFCQKDTLGEFILAYALG
jgi:hypothetical protein